MRLLSLETNDQFKLTTFTDDESLPPYAILSHTWIEGQEVIYDELIAGTGKEKAGYDKLRFCGERAAQDCLQYFWVDTCCIDKRNNTELGTAINSMFRLYQRAARCYVFLLDVVLPHHVPDPHLYRITWRDAFRRSRWFTRGWTLQELIAPASVEFFSKERKRLGDKISLEQEISEITDLPIEVLRGQSLAEFSTDERMSWVARRKTAIKEDKAYCLFGIFGVFMPLIYGEGMENAFRRLRKEIHAQELEQVYKEKMESEKRIQLQTVISENATLKQNLAEQKNLANRHLWDLQNCRADLDDATEVRDRLAAENKHAKAELRGLNDVNIEAQKAIVDKGKEITRLERSYKSLQIAKDHLESEYTKLGQWASEREMELEVTQRSREQQLGADLDDATEVRDRLAAENKHTKAELRGLNDVNIEAQKAIVDRDKEITRLERSYKSLQIAKDYLESEYTKLVQWVSKRERELEVTYRSQEQQLVATLNAERVDHKGALQSLERSYQQIVEDLKAHHKNILQSRDVSH